MTASAMATRRMRGAAGAAVGLGGFLLLWAGVVTLFHMSPLVLPSPVVVATTLAALLASADFWVNFKTSVLEFAFGFVLAVSSGVAVGITVALVPRIREFAEPLLDATRFIVPFSLVPLAALWFGIADSGKIFIVWYSMFFVIVLNTSAAIENIDPLLLRAATMLRLDFWTRLRLVLVPASLRRLLIGLRIAVALGWIAVIAAEYIAARHGLGFMITQAALGLETPTVIAGMVVIGAVGGLLSFALEQLTRRLTPWEQRA